jgi:hypothetical protein
MKTSYSEDMGERYETVIQNGVPHDVTGGIHTHACTHKKLCFQCQLHINLKN